MDDRTRDRLVELFARGRELPTDERAAFCARECADDPRLRAELQSLLDARWALDDDDFLASPAPRIPGWPTAGADPDAGAWEPRETAIPEIPGYENLVRIGAGGMGTVYRADQIRPFHRVVALKIVQAHLASPGVIARFEAEYRSLARMRHRFVASVYDAGVTGDGRPYFVMEYVDGAPIHRHCDREQLATRARIELFQKVCSAVQHAHQMGILHRDLKPTNILVTGDGDVFVPKVIDFGIAKSIGDADTDLQTVAGTLLGTPEYMSPEQALGGAQQIDTRSDVYSLGVVLYELLTGSLPFDGRRMRDAGPTGMARILCEETPPRPSTRVTARGDADAVGATRGTDPDSLRRQLRGDLDWIVMRALEKDPDRRYVSPLALSEDLGRLLRHEPVEASPPSALYRARRLLRRHRVPFAAAALVLVSLVAVVVATARALVVARQSAASESVARREIEASHALAEDHLRDFHLLSLAVREERARIRAAGFMPPWPSRAPAMRAWLAKDLGPLVAALPEARATIEELDRRGRTAAGDDADAFLRDTLRVTIARIEALAQNDAALVRRNLAWADRVAELTIGRFADRWAEARRAIRAADGVVASEAYRAVPIDLAPQLGLIPIGMNPVSKLWEFYHLRSAWDPDRGVDPAELEIPTAAGDGTVDVHGRGIVFVLVPGGTFAMGAQATDASAPHHDPDAGDSEAPVHDVTLAPFFVAKHELTGGQWSRLCGEPAPESVRSRRLIDADGADSIDHHPVHLVDWTGCDRLLTAFGLALPTEAQWEFACRAGTSGKWSSGPTAADLAGSANILFGAPGGSGEPEPAASGAWPVGSGRANPFGLHDMHGNVWEWCRDWSLPYGRPAREGDGLRVPEQGEASMRARRGGSWKYGAYQARSTNRTRSSPSTRVEATGCRAVRAVLAEPR